MRVDELAKGWLLALVEDVPLDEAAAILTGDFARDGPRICDAVVRAVSDEADLRRIHREGVLEPLVARAGELAGARTAEAAVHAVETLKDVIWGALRSELAQDDPDLVVDAAERLALVAEHVRAAVLRRPGDAQAASSRPGRVAPLRVARADPAAAPREEPVVPGGPVDRGQGSDAPDDTDRSGRGDALWIDALGDEIASAGRAQSSLSLLLVELEEAERLVAVEPLGEAAATFGRFAQAVRTSVRRRDVLACETDSRVWIIARDTGRAGAQALGTRIVTLLPAEETWRDAPLTVSVGLAVLGEDGHNASALIDAAEQARFAAEASGIGIVGGEGDADSPSPSLAS